MATAAAAGNATAAQKTDQYVQAQPQGTTSASLGLSTARPSRASDLSKLVKPAETHLLRISETQRPEVAAELRGLHRGIEAKAREGSSAFGAAGAGVAGALTETAGRVLQRLAEGRINPDEAKQSLGQVDLMAEAARMVKAGQLPNLRDGGVDLLFGHKYTQLQFDIKKGDDTYTVQLLTRPETGKSEKDDTEARINLRLVQKNGAPLPEDQQVDLRVVHQREQGTAAVQVQSTLLDKKIHGQPRDERGQPMKGADNKFQQALPAELNAAEGFARLVQGFDQGVVEPQLRKLPPRQGIAYQTDNNVSLEAIGRQHGAEVARTLGGLNESIDALARQGAACLGPAAECMTRAVDTTTDRILGRLAQGALSPQEAQEAMEQVKVLATALKGVNDGTVAVQGQPGKNLKDPEAKGYSFNVQVGADSFRVKVATRPVGSEGTGEARVGFTVTEKNGEKLSESQQVGLRIDLASFDGKPEVDVASALLDYKVHGPMDFAKTGGLIIPDHHFHAGMPQSLEDPAAYAKFVSDFRDTHLRPKE
jgi:hypothetical protein